MKYIGKIKIGEEEKILSLSKKNGKYEYFLDNENIGLYDPITMYGMEEKILFKENTLANELSSNIRDEIEDLVDILDEEELEEMQPDYEKEQVDVLEQLLQLEENEDITRIATVKLDEKIENKQNEEELKKKKDTKNETEKVLGTEKDVTIKQEMNFNDKVTDIRDLGQLISDEGKMPKLEGKKFVKMGIIESEQMDNLTNTSGKIAKENTTRYSFVAIASDGTVVPMELEQDYQEGDNPTEKNYQVSRNGEIKQDDVLSRFKIGEGTFSVKNGRYGELEVYHSPRKTLGGKGVEGNKSLDIQLETDNVWERTDEERELVGEHTTGYRSVERSYQEAKVHEIDGKACENLEIEDIDGDEQTKSHLPENEEIEEDFVKLENGNKITFAELATKWGLYKDGKPDEEYAKQKFEEKNRENGDNNLSNEQIIEEIEEEYNEEFMPDGNR